MVEVSEVGHHAKATCRNRGETIDLAELQEAWEGSIESVFPYRSTGEEKGTTVNLHLRDDAPKRRCTAEPSRARRM